jgi:hypothetical protein
MRRHGQALAARSPRAMTLTGAGDPAPPSAATATSVPSAAPPLSIDVRGAARAADGRRGRRYPSALAAAVRSIRLSDRLQLDARRVTVLGVLPDAATSDRQTAGAVPGATAGEPPDVQRRGGSARRDARAGRRGGYGARPVRAGYGAGRRSSAAPARSRLRHAHARALDRRVNHRASCRGLLLVTATANIASLQLARATTRHRELAFAALGAGTARVTRQLLVEASCWFSRRRFGPPSRACCTR